jgi:hypothetical protein
MLRIITTSLSKASLSRDPTRSVMVMAMNANSSIDDVLNKKELAEEARFIRTREKAERLQAKKDKKDKAPAENSNGNKSDPKNIPPSKAEIFLSDSCYPLPRK